jgi:hypothetical protein
MHNKPILATISVLFLAFSIYAGVLLISNNDTDNRSQAADIPTLSLTTDEISYPANVNFAVTVKLDTAKSPVDKIKAVLTYDPQALTALSITPLQAYQSQVVETQEIDTKKGEVSLLIKPALGTPPNDISSSIGIIVFQAKKEGVTLINLDPQSSASIKPGNANIISSLIPLSLAITP